MVRTTTRSSPPEHPVVHNIQAIAELERKALDDRTPLDRLTDAVARVSGSMTFVALHACWFTAWIAWNSTRLAFDPFPTVC